MFASILAALLIATTPTAAPACYSVADIAKVFHYAKTDHVYKFTNKDGKVFMQYFDTKSKLYFFIPVNVNCLQPEYAFTVTPYHISYFKEMPFA